MMTIGFTKEYYTLWEVGDTYAVPVFDNGIKVGQHFKQDLVYIQNLSIDFDAARAKVAATGKVFNVDLDLRGSCSHTRTIGSDIRDRDSFFPQNCFSFGKLEGESFETCNDIWQLERAMNDEKSLRRRAAARRRLIVLGELVRFTWTNEAGVKFNWVNKNQVGRLKAEQWSGHFFADGQKVELELMEISRGGFEGAYGFTSIRNYQTRDNKVVTYKGSSPISLPEGWNKVTATVKHNSYNGRNQTLLLRMKIKA